MSKEDYIAEPAENLAEGSKVDKYDNISDIPMDIPSDMEGDMNFDMNVEGGEIVEDGVMLPEGAVPGGDAPTGNGEGAELMPLDASKAGEQTKPQNAENAGTTEGTQPAETKDATKDAGGKK